MNLAIRVRDESSASKSPVCLILSMGAHVTWVAAGGWQIGWQITSHSCQSWACKSTIGIAFWLPVLEESRNAMKLKIACSGWHRAFDELSFGEFAQESSTFFGVKKLRKWSHDIWSYSDLLQSCMKQSVHAIHDLRDKNMVNKMQYPTLDET